MPSFLQDNHSRPPLTLTLRRKEFKDFVEKMIPAVSDIDDEVPPLPPRDLIYRIYRDVRFSNDKTPYKTFFCATFSRTGRKTMFAGCESVNTP